MTARFTRISFLGFVGLTFAISYNALFLQEKSRPGLSTKSTHGQAKPGRAQVARGKRQAPASALSTSHTNMIKAIQRELQARGYDPGPVDGVAGTFTRAAIMAYQSDTSLPVTGDSSGSLLEHIVLGESTGPVSEQTEVPGETMALIKKVQQFLEDRGYKPGPVDGIIGTGTKNAVRAFESDQNLPQTGRISGKLLRKIATLTGTEFASVAQD